MVPSIVLEMERAYVPLEWMVNNTNTTCHPPDGPSHAVDVISTILGWTYFFAWSLSFYPQVYLNWRRKSVVGLNFDFLLFNILGYVCYSFFNVAVYWIKPVQEAFLKEFGDGESPVALNDVIFALHGFVITSFTIFQCFIYDRGNQKLSTPAIVLTSGGALLFVVIVIMISAGFGHLFVMVSIIGYIKVAMTLFKYIPQNYKRKSTIGWSIGNILLDMTGGVLSFGQQFLNAINHCDWSSFEGANLAKTGLSAISIVFDILFMIQHYVLYKDNNSDVDILPDFGDDEVDETSPLTKTTNQESDPNIQSDSFSIVDLDS